MMDPPQRANTQIAQLGDEALERIAATLAELYGVLYEERALDARASLTGNMLAFVFEDGLSVSDEWFLRRGQDAQLREFREGFFEAISEQLAAVVSDLTGVPVTYAFYGFDPQTRTTHAIFVLDLSELGSEQRRAVLNWSEQVRRNAKRLRAEHVATRETHHQLREEMRRFRETRTGGDADTDGAEPSGSVGA